MDKKKIKEVYVAVLEIEGMWPDVICVDESFEEAERNIFEWFGISETKNYKNPATLISKENIGSECYDELTIYKFKDTLLGNDDIDIVYLYQRNLNGGIY